MSGGGSLDDGRWMLDKKGAATFREYIPVYSYVTYRIHMSRSTDPYYVRHHTFTVEFNFSEEKRSPRRKLLLVNIYFIQQKSLFRHALYEFKFIVVYFLFLSNAFLILSRCRRLDLLRRITAVNMLIFFNIEHIAPILTTSLTGPM